MAKKSSTDLFNDVKQDTSADFGTLFEQSLGTAGRRLKVGDALKAEILSIGKEESFVSTGTPNDAIIMTRDLLDENNAVKYKVGEIIDVIVTKIKGDEIRAIRKGAKGAPADVDSLEDAFDMELPVEGKITEVVNGGYRVSINGALAFCPLSQLDSRMITDTAGQVGKKYEFLITQFEPGKNSQKRNIVVSRRKLLDLQKAENEGAWLETHKVGDVLQGRVTRVENFGAFVEVDGGVEGLVHISELGFTRLKHASEAVREGDPVQVKILKIEEADARLKISFSVKQAGGIGDPWMQVPVKYPVGTILDGVVDKKETFGIFVVIESGINGLLPKSKWRDSLEATQYETKKKGEVIKVRIDEIKFEERKISLGLPTETDDQSWKQHQGNQSFGALAAAFGKAEQKTKSKK